MLACQLTALRDGRSRGSVLKWTVLVLVPRGVSISFSCLDISRGGFQSETLSQPLRLSQRLLPDLGLEQFFNIHVEHPSPSHVNLWPLLSAAGGSGLASALSLEEHVFEPRDQGVVHLVTSRYPTYTVDASLSSGACLFNSQLAWRLRAVRAVASQPASAESGAVRPPRVEGTRFQSTYSISPVPVVPPPRHFLSLLIKPSKAGR